ncbi:MAG: laminin B domain-containing protein [Myxococcaceae bacterium]
MGFREAVGLVAAAGVFVLAGCGVDVPALPSLTQVSSAFDSDADGWTVAGDANGASVLPIYSATGGNPGGYVSAKDDVTGGTWYWQAPAKFLGDQSANYGKLFKFDQRVQETTLMFEEARDIVLRSGDTELVFDVATAPGTAWTPVSVLLSESSGWKVGNAAPTPEQFKNALKTISGLYIRGEYRVGADTGSLDNVSFGVNPN